jgi:D-arabinose 1-dehydrogenase-like Zn-dependent alcohol dehydrogenase
MKSYQFAEYGQALQPTDQETPTPQGDEVLLRIRACGVCHSDIHMWDGHFDLGNGRELDISRGRALPFTLGHEIAGEVVALGPTAEGVSVGAQRVVFPWIGCGACPVCESDNEHLCSRPRALGTSVDGGFSDHVMVPHARYLFDYGDVPTELACTYACSGLTAYSALDKIREHADGRTLVIIGAGGVGFAGLHIARALFDTQLIVVDIDDAKLQAAKEGGAAHVFDANDKGALKEIRNLTDGGTGAAIDFVGSESSASFGLKILGNSGVLIGVGLFGGALSVPLPLLTLRHITIRGSYLGSLRQMSELMQLVRDGSVTPIPVEARPLAQAQQTLEDLRGGRVLGRVVLEP